MPREFSPAEYRASLLEQLAAGEPEWVGTPTEEARHDWFAARQQQQQQEGERQPHMDTSTCYTDPMRGLSNKPSSSTTTLARSAHDQGQVQIDGGVLNDSNGPCPHSGSHGCPCHSSMVMDFIDNCVAANVPEHVIARQVEFMISTMEEVIGLHTALQERFHKDRQREYQLSQLSSAVERQERLRQQERERAVEQRLEDNRRRLHRKPIDDEMTPLPRLREWPSPRATSATYTPITVTYTPPSNKKGDRTAIARSSWRSNAVLSPPARPVAAADAAARLSPMRYGRAGYRLMSPKRWETDRASQRGSSPYTGTNDHIVTSPRQSWQPREDRQEETTPTPPRGRATRGIPGSRPEDPRPVREAPALPRKETARHSSRDRISRSGPPRYLQPTHASVAHRSASRSTAEDGEPTEGEMHGRDCAYCHRAGTFNAAPHPHDTASHTLPQRRRASVTSATTRRSTPSRRPVLGEGELARARESVTRPTKASQLRAEAAARRRQGLPPAKPTKPSADFDVSRDEDAEGSDATERPPTTAQEKHFSPPPPLPAPSRPSIEKRNGFSDSRDSARSASTSFVTLLQQRAREEEGTCGHSAIDSNTTQEKQNESTEGTLHTTNTFLTSNATDAGGPVGTHRNGQRDSPSINMGELSRQHRHQEAQVRQDFEDMLRQTRSATFTQSHRSRLSSEDSATASAIAARRWQQQQQQQGRTSTVSPPLTSPELQLFMEVSQRKIRESERVLARTTPNVSLIADGPGAAVSSFHSPLSSSALSGASFTVYTPPRAFAPLPASAAPQRPGVAEGQSPMVEISPTSSDEDASA